MVVDNKGGAGGNIGAEYAAKQSADGYTLMLSGQTQFGFPTFSTALPQVKAGKLRGLAVTGPKRHPLLPDVPTLLEAMPNGFDLEAWFGIWAPAGTPDEFSGYVKSETAKWARVVKESGARID